MLFCVIYNFLFLIQNLLVIFQKNIYLTYKFSFMFYDFLGSVPDPPKVQKVRIRPDPDPQHWSHGLRTLYYLEVFSGCVRQILTMI